MLISSAERFPRFPQIHASTLNLLGSRRNTTCKQLEHSSIGTSRVAEHDLVIRPTINLFLYETCESERHNGRLEE